MYGKQFLKLLYSHNNIGYKFINQVGFTNNLIRKKRF